MARLCNLDRGFEHRNGGQRSFVWPSPNFEPKTGLNLSEDLFFSFHLILGRKTDLVLGWKVFILVFIILKFSEFSGPPLSKILRTLLHSSPLRISGYAPGNFVLFIVICLFVAFVLSNFFLIVQLQTL